jgi:protoporphyrinogen oxidase
MQTRKKLLSKEVQGYLMGSFQLMIDEIEERIKENDGKIFVNSDIKKVYKKRDKIIVESGKKKFYFDKVVITTALPIFLEITRGLPEDYREKLRKTDYRAALVLVLKLKKSFMPYYWLNINDRSIPFVMLMEHTNFIPKENYDGSHILYVSMYTSHKNKYYLSSKNKLIKSYVEHLKKINPEFDISWIKESWVFKTDYGTHVPTLNYSKKIPNHTTPIKGLYLASGCQIYPVDRGMSESIALGRKIADMLLK